GGADDIREPDAEFLVHDHDFAVSHEGSIHENVQGLAGGAVELHDGALVELQQVADGDAGAPDFHGKSDRHVKNDVQVHFLRALLALVLEVVELGGACLYVGVHGTSQFLLTGRFSGLAKPPRRTFSSNLMACWPCDRPKLPRNMGTSSASTSTLPVKSQLRMSPGLRFSSSARVMLVRPRRVDSSTSASSISSRRVCAQRSSLSTRSLAMPESSTS